MELIYIFLSHPSLYTYLGNSVSLYTDYEKHYCFPQPQTTNRCMRPASLCTYKRNSNSKTWDFWKLQIFFVVGWPLCGALPIHGELLKGSGLYEILVNSNLSVIGKGAVVNANRIKQAIYCLQVTVRCCICKTKRRFCKNDSILTPIEWLQERKRWSQMFFYWDMFINLEIDTLLYIKVISGFNYDFCVLQLFTMDHCHCIMHDDALFI